MLLLDPLMIFPFNAFLSDSFVVQMMNDFFPYFGYPLISSRDGIRKNIVGVYLTVEMLAHFFTL